jgi:hypothetical protein
MTMFSLPQTVLVPVLTSVSKLPLLIGTSVILISVHITDLIWLDCLFQGPSPTKSQTSACEFGEDSSTHTREGSLSHVLSMNYHNEIVAIFLFET